MTAEPAGHERPQIRIAFVAGVSPIVRDAAAARELYAETLGIDFEGLAGDYASTEQLGGVKHLGLWPLAEAAQGCFGAAEWPADVPVPQATLEFEVEDVDAVAAAAEVLRSRGYRLIHEARTEPWNQTITRLLTPERLLLGICYTPWFHESAASADESST